MDENSVLQVQSISAVLKFELFQWQQYFIDLNEVFNNILHKDFSLYFNLQQELEQAKREISVLQLRGKQMAKKHTALQLELRNEREEVGALHYHYVSCGYTEE